MIKLLLVNYVGVNLQTNRRFTNSSYFKSGQDLAEWLERAVNSGVTYTVTDQLDVEVTQEQYEQIQQRRKLIDIPS